MQLKALNGIDHVLEKELDVLGRGLRRGTHHARFAGAKEDNAEKKTGSMKNGEYSETDPPCALKPKTDENPNGCVFTVTDPKTGKTAVATDAKKCESSTRGAFLESFPTVVASCKHCMSTEEEFQSFSEPVQFKEGEEWMVLDMISGKQSQPAVGSVLPEGRMVQAEESEEKVEEETNGGGMMSKVMGKLGMGETTSTTTTAPDKPEVFQKNDNTTPNLEQSCGAWKPEDNRPLDGADPANLH